ncbi:uncharacterized protein LOC121781700 [Salvia splendens]|uniref:uncharacterized protein LOC121781700 n=1 Tax=Salvia splendens TaxID=180675 RepID=UPI001C271532|nr:uncharacterized protein LOC121781700 [Salvia splendens]
MVETGRLLFVRTQQKKLHAEMYSGLAEAVLRGDTDGSMHVTDPCYYENVKEYMVHGPCGVVRKSSPCMRNGRCSKYFPKKFVGATTFDDEGYPIYKRRDSGRVIMKDGMPLDNRYIVPHNRALLMKYGGHVNVEWCNQSRSIKYLFKYINKGHDRVTTSFFQFGANGSDQLQDEISLYYDCKYISSCEAAWRILGFEIQYKDPSIERLSFHLPNEQSVIFYERESLDNVLNRNTIHQSKFLGWMDANKIYSEGRDLTYGEFPTKFMWKTDHWQPRKQRFSIGRLFYVPPSSGDIYYLRCLLNIFKGATSYEDIRRVNGVQYDTFRDACFALGLLDDDKEYVDGIIEASFWSSVHSIRLLFVSLLTLESISRLDFVWLSCWKYLSEDVLYNQRKLISLPGLLLSDEDVQNFALVEIEKLLLNVGKSLRDFQGMPYPKSEFFETFENRLICDELCYDREALGREHLDFLSKFTDEQLHVHDTIMSSVYSNGGGMFFVYGYGGTGKTFILRSLSAGIRSRSEIVLNVASSGIVSLLLLGGRTTHSRFKIPINVDEDSMQILSVVPKDSRQDDVNVVINSSYLWKYCTVLRLTKNMRLLSAGSCDEAECLKEFSSWVASIGDGVLGGPNDGEVIGLPSYIIYPSYMNHEELSGCLRDRAILTPTLEIVDEVNQFMMSLDQPEGTPNHELLLKVGTHVMLLGNIDHSNGLCNGTRLLIT